MLAFWYDWVEPDPHGRRRGCSCDRTTRGSAHATGRRAVHGALVAAGDHESHTSTSLNEMARDEHVLHTTSADRSVDCRQRVAGRRARSGSVGFADWASVSVAISDLNGDQVPDLAVASRGTCAPRSWTLLRRLGDVAGRCCSGRGNGTRRHATFTGAYLEHLRCETLEASLALPGGGAQRTVAINPRPCTP